MRFSRKGRRVALVVGAAALAALSGLAATTGGKSGGTPASLSDQGVLVISRQGQPLGTERFSLRQSAAGATLSAALDYHLAGHPGGRGQAEVRQQAELRLGPGLALQTYVWTEGDGGHPTAKIALRYDDGRIQAHYQKTKGAGLDYQFVMPATTAILDDNVFSLWEALADRYDWARGGEQTFPVFVPHSGDPTQVVFSPLPAAPGTQRLRAQTDQARIEIVLREGKIQSLEDAGAELSVVRRR